jgi:hypothetical protein
LSERHFHQLPPELRLVALARHAGMLDELDAAGLVTPG